MAEPAIQNPEEENSREQLPVLIEDVLHYVFQWLSVRDLVSCRLVNLLWCKCATLQLKFLSSTLKLVTDLRNKSLLEFARSIQNNNPNRPLPYGRYHLDLCYTKNRDVTAALQAVLRKISSEKCYKLKVVHIFRPLSCQNVKDSAVARQCSLSFVQLESLEFLIRFYEGFDPEHFMSEILQRSEGIKRLNVHLSSYLSRETQRPILSKIFHSLINPDNNFRRLTTLGIDYTFLTEEHLKILTEWSQPLQNLCIGTFDLKPDREYPFPCDVLHTFLGGLSGSLRNLKIKVDKEFPWEEIRDRLDYGFDYGEEIRNPFHVMNVEPVRFTFPVMRILEGLEIVAANVLDSNWAWRLDNNIFPEHFPNLKKFRLVQFQYSICKSKRNSPGFLPKLHIPSSTVEELTLPYPLQEFDHVLMQHMLSLFPHIRIFEIKYNREAVEAVFTSLPTLEIFKLHLGEELVPLDSLLTGVPDIKPNFKYEVALNYNLEANRRCPSLLQLKNLQELYLTTEDYYVRITDITAYHVFLKMEKFHKLTVMASPWEETTTWRFSEECMRTMQQKIKMTLQVSPVPLREKFFSY